MTFKISFTEFKSSKNIHGTLKTLNFQEFCSYLGKFEIGSKEGLAWSPALFTDSQRKNKHVLSLSGFVADFDDGKIAPEEATSCLEERGLHCICHHSYSHTPEHPKFRVIVPFADSLKLHPEAWSKVLWPKLRAYLGLAGCDEACKDPSRFYYLPRKASEELSHGSANTLDEDRVFFDPKTLFSAEDLQQIEAPKVALKPLEVEQPERIVDLVELRSKLRACGGYARSLADGHELSPPPQERGEYDSPRHTVWMAATKTLATVADDWMGTAALLEICKASLEKMRAKGDRHTLEQIQEMIESGRAKAPQWRAEEEARKLISRKYGGLEAEVNQNPDVKLSDTVWLQRIFQDHQGRAIPNEANAVTVFREHPLWKGRIKFNLTTKDVDIDTKNNPEFSGAHEGGTLTDLHMTAINIWFQKTENLRCRLNTDVLHASINKIAHENEYNPILDWVRSIPWDGIGRVDTFLITHFQIATINDAGEDITGAVKEASREFLLQAVARQLKPGCKADALLILEGEENLGKTLGLQTLFGLKYSHTSGIDPRGGVDGRSPNSRYWAVIDEEGKLIRKHLSEEIKGYTTQQIDQYRYKYARLDTQVPRTSVMMSTTNAIEYLPEQQGNRRFLPVRCASKINISKIEQDRQQVFAEALMRVEANEDWWTDDPVVFASLNALRETRTIVDSVQDAIRCAYLEKPPNQRPLKMSITQVYEMIKDRISIGGKNWGLGAHLLTLGWKRNTQKHGESITYSPPAAWLTMPQNASGNIYAMPQKRLPS